MVLSCPLTSSPVEMPTAFQPGQEDVICISALPPYALAPARTLCRQIRGRFPKTKLVVGLWGFKGDMDKANAHFERGQPDRLMTSLAEAVVQIEELAPANTPLPQSRDRSALRGITRGTLSGTL